MIIAVVLMVAMWIYVLYLAFGPGHKEPPDRLKGRAFPVAAQATCIAALDLVAKLPPAFTSKDAADRAVVLAQANADLAHMLDQLDRMVPSGADGQVTREWLADWRTYLGNREDYARALRTNPKARLLVTPEEGQPDHRLPGCLRRRQRHAGLLHPRRRRLNLRPAHLSSTPTPAAPPAARPVSLYAGRMASSGRSVRRTGRTASRCRWSSGAKRASRVSAASAMRSVPGSTS